MIIGVGIDLVSISRISEKIKNRVFVEKVFTQVEIDYCESSTKREQHYAGRFAVKEAFLKATGKGMSLSYDLKDIAVAKDEFEKPEIQLAGEFEKIRSAERWNSIHVSLSHEGDNAIAIVIIEK